MILGRTPIRLVIQISFIYIIYTNISLAFCISEKSVINAAFYKKHAEELAKELADERSSRLEEIQRMHEGAYKTYHCVYMFVQQQECQKMS